MIAFITLVDFFFNWQQKKHITVFKRKLECCEMLSLGYKIAVADVNSGSCGYMRPAKDQSSQKFQHKVV